MAGDAIVSRKKRADHVLAHDGSHGFYGFSCEHCGAKQAMPKLCEFGVYTAACKAFLENHRACAPTTKQEPRP
jgi:hypothetical protein